MTTNKTNKTVQLLKKNTRNETLVNSSVLPQPSLKLCR